MNLFDNLIELRITSADVDSLCDRMWREGVAVYSLSRLDELTIDLTIRKKDYLCLRKLIDVRGDELKEQRRHGIYWSIKNTFKRPVIYVSSIILLFLTLYLPTKVLFFGVSGNEIIPERRIIEAAAQCGIKFGVDRRQIRNETFKNEMLSQLPEIEWAGINTRGCVAYISVREKGNAQEHSGESPSNVVAMRDAVITDIAVSKGSVQCAVGDAVLKGQLLISGYTDCGKVLLQGRAEGEVYGYTSRELTAVVPLLTSKKTESAKQEIRYSLLVGKKRINLWKGSGICPTTCDRIYQEYWVQLPGGFVLPVCLVRETVRYYEAAEGSLTSGEDAILAGMFRYLREHMVAGSVLHQDLCFSEENGILSAKGIFGCHEMIGQQISEESGELYG